MTQANLPDNSLQGRWAQKIAHALYLDNKECEAVYNYLMKYTLDLFDELNKFRKDSRSGE